MSSGLVEWGVWELRVKGVRPSGKRVGVGSLSGGFSSPRFTLSSSGRLEPVC